MAKKKKLKYAADVKYIQQAIEGVGNGFNWIESPQGIDYWNDVMVNLEKILDEVRPVRASRKRS